MKEYFVYIMASFQRTLYVGVTNDLGRRVSEHKWARVPGFTKRYRVNRLVYMESTQDVWASLEREKPLKGWLRRRKVELIESVNAEWNDLAAERPSPGAPDFDAVGQCHPERSEGSSAIVVSTKKILRSAQDDNIRNGSVEV